MVASTSPGEYLGDKKKLSVDFFVFFFQEFKACVPVLKEWNVNVRDASATFKIIDENNGGMVLFNEFAAWAITQCNDYSILRCFGKVSLLSSKRRTPFSTGSKSWKKSDHFLLFFNLFVFFLSIGLWHRIGCRNWRTKRCYRKRSIKNHIFVFASVFPLEFWEAKVVLLIFESIIMVDFGINIFSVV